MFRHGNKFHQPTPKTHYKLYKAGKLWLTAAITTIAITGGAIVTAQAATTATDDSTALTTEAANDLQSDKSTTMGTPQSDDPQTESNSDTTPSEPTTGKDGLPDDGSSSQDKPADDSAEDIHSDDVTQEDKGADQPESTETKSESKENPVSNDSKIDTDKIVTPLRRAREATAPTPTAVSLTNLPQLSNFYVDITNGMVTTYNADAPILLMPYFFGGSKGMAVDNPLYGFYVVMPDSTTATLTDFKKGAAQYVTTIKKYANIQSLDVFQLRNTRDGRQVFYFRPNDGAKVTYADSTAKYKDQPKMILPIRTTSDRAYTSVSANAGSLAEVSKTGVLFAGIGDLTKPLSGGYVSVPVSSLGDNIGAPDANIEGIALTSGGISMKRVVNYVESNITDNYTVYDASNGNQLLTSTPVPVIGHSGTSYKVTLADLGLSTTDYWEPSLKLADGTPVGNVTRTASQIEYRAPVAGSTLTAPGGQAYTVYVSRIQTTLTPKNSTLVAGPKAKWDLMTNLETAIGPDGTPLQASDLTVNGKVDTTQPGPYSVTFSYLDAQNNKTTSDPATIIVTASPLAIHAATAGVTLPAGATWTAGTGITGLTGSDGQPVSVTDALSRQALTATIQDADGQPVTTIDPAKAGIYTVNYTYTDDLGNTVTATVPVTVSAPTTTDPGDGTGTTMPGNGTGTTKPTDPNHGTDPTEPTIPPTIPTDPQPGKTPQPTGKPTTGQRPGLVSQKPTYYSTTQPSTPRRLASGYAKTSSSTNDSTTTSTSTTLPQTNDQSTWWTALGALLLSITSALGFRRRW
ncbi:KxYKxGKxW signal peptide domain-containing protein [Levilactobacillus lindianensis]|uniref:KxYKxGKxW signal peptide domain-containing protein n=1 Tax=Levilactobacillus lindianensis TaxID=2486018 RepID=UPI000F744A19|nr:KxYKxGKxW signal peptide domain-containing protein [Levilactobacillus lindianensis]